MFVDTENYWKMLKQHLTPNPNTLEDIYKPKDYELYYGEKTPVFTYNVSEENKGTRTLLDFFNENDMLWD